MLKRSARLNVSDNFKWVMGGSRVETAHMKLFYRMGANPNVASGLDKMARVGVAVNSKEFKKAHLRVEAKRRCFDSARIIYDSLPEGLNLVIMPKSSILECETDDLVAEIKNAKIFS